MVLRSAAVALLGMMSASAAWAQQLDPAAISVIVRSRVTEASYSVFFWNKVSREGEEPVEEWTAEFHKRDLHRVESPRERVIADCASGTGTYYSIESGETFTNPAIARMSCGIDATMKLLEATHNGTRDTPFGMADQLTIRNPEGVRTYEILQNGAIVGQTITNSGGFSLILRARALKHDAPDDIFSIKSLERSAVPDEFKQAPSE